MLIGVISDTHIRANSKRTIPDEVWNTFKGADMILHAGDVVSQTVLDELAAVAPTFAVHGNNDELYIETNCPTSRRLEIEGCVIGLTHGHVPLLGAVAPPLEYIGNRQTAGNALSHFVYDGDVNCIIFGHSHRPLLEWHEVDGQRILLLNPGSPTDKRYSPTYGCARLRVHNGEVEGELITW